MEEQDYLKLIAKERYELELMSIELKRMHDLVLWNKSHPTTKLILDNYNDRSLKIKIDIQKLKIDLQRLDLEYLNDKLYTLNIQKASAK